MPSGSVDHASPPLIVSSVIHRVSFAIYLHRPLHSNVCQRKKGPLSPVATRSGHGRSPKGRIHHCDDSTDASFDAAYYFRSLNSLFHDERLTNRVNASSTEEWCGPVPQVFDDLGLIHVTRLDDLTDVHRLYHLVV